MIQKILKKLIKNNTPYIPNRIYITFEKYSDYTGYGYGKMNILNSTIINLKYLNFSLVSRVITDGTPDKNKVELIEKYTGGYIRPYLVEGFTDTDEGTIKDCFVTKDGKFIGDLERAWFFYKNSMKVCDAYPHGCASVYESNTYYRENQSFLTMKGYYGYTHRAGCTFMLGDKIYEEKWYPKSFLEVDEDTLDIFMNHCEVYKINPNDNLELLADFVPYKQHGYKTITNMDEAKQSAINFSKAH